MATIGNDYYARDLFWKLIIKGKLNDDPVFLRKNCSSLLVKQKTSLQKNSIKYIEQAITRKLSGNF